MNILSFKKNVYSQNGEDGVLEHLFNQLQITKGTFFEFGAADGVWISNTRKLVDEGWKGLLVESNQSYEESLRRNLRGYPVVCKIASVSPHGDTSIDRLWNSVKDEMKGSDLDFLSIDTGGKDDELIENMVLQPKVIMIEVNAGHHPEYNQRISSSSVGQSLEVICSLLPNYTPIAYTGNLILVRNDQVHLVSQYVVSLPQLYNFFWASLDEEAKAHLNKTFVKNDPRGTKQSEYNGHTFDTSHLHRLVFQDRVLSSQQDFPFGPPKKFIVWGITVQSWTHYYIHEAVFKAASWMYGKDNVLWMDDLKEEADKLRLGLELAKSNLDNVVFWTVGGQDRHIPLHPKSFYILHNEDPKHYSSIPNEQKITMQVYTRDVLGRKTVPIPYRKFHFWQKDDQEWGRQHGLVYMPWATDLLPHEVSEQMCHLSKKTSHNQRGLFVGYTNWGDSEHENMSVISSFRKELGLNQVTLDVEMKRNVPSEFLKYQLAPTLCGKWQKSKGYIPCRIFKTISYGQLGITNCKEAAEIIGEGLVIYDDDETKLAKKAVEMTASPQFAQSQIIKSMRIVRDHHTYLNRLLTLQEIFMEKKRESLGLTEESKHSSTHPSTQPSHPQISIQTSSLSEKKEKIMTLEEWQTTIKPHSEFIFNASPQDGNDGWVPFSIGVAWPFYYQQNQEKKTQIGVHSKTVLCAIASDSDSKRRCLSSINRKKIVAALKSKGIKNQFLDYNEYFESLPDYKFVISPEGNGIDCHRHYEAIMAGCIPIVEDNEKIREKYKGCPVVFTKDYSEISESYLEEIYKKMKDQLFDFSKMILSSWDVATREKIMENGNAWSMRILGKKWYL